MRVFNAAKGRIPKTKTRWRSEVDSRTRPVSDSDWSRVLHPAAAANADHYRSLFRRMPQQTACWRELNSNHRATSWTVS